NCRMRLLAASCASWAPLRLHKTTSISLNVAMIGRYAFRAMSPIPTIAMRIPKLLVRRVATAQFQQKCTPLARQRQDRGPAASHPLSIAQKLSQRIHPFPIRLVHGSHPFVVLEARVGTVRQQQFGNFDREILVVFGKAEECCPAG